MWMETTKAGKVAYRERYKDVMTGKYKTVCITLDKDSAQNRKKASWELQKMIADKTAAVMTSNTTLLQLKVNYLAYQQKNVRMSTYERNARTLNKLCPVLGDDVLVEKLTANYVKDKLLAITQEPATLNEYLKRLRAMFNWGYQSDLHDNFALIKKLVNFKDKTHREKISDKYLEADEVCTLLDAMRGNEHWYYLTKFMLLSGLRIGEVIALEVADIKDSYITVDKTYDVIHEIIGPPKTLMSIRDVYIQPELDACIKSYLKWRKSYSVLTGIRSKHLFFNSSGGYLLYASYEKYLKEVSQRVLGRRITTHTLRHTHASLLLAEGVPLETISRRLGHDNSRITKEIYIHTTQKLVERDNQHIKNAHII